MTLLLTPNLTTWQMLALNLKDVYAMLLIAYMKDFIKLYL